MLNGPLGIGKSTLAEALTEAFDGCVLLDGDWIVAANPPAVDEREHLHTTIALLIAHHRRFGYRHFVVNHLWTSAEDLDDLRRGIDEADPGVEVRCFLLTLPEEENLRRIARRQQAREIDEREFEARTVAEERAMLARTPGLGEPFDVSAAPGELVASLLARVGR